MLKKSLIYHLIPFTIAVTLVIIIIFISSPLRLNKNELGDSVIKGEQQKTKGLYDNLLAGEQSEIDFIGSIKNPAQLTIFGSSELSETPFAPYYFLPDSLSIAALGIGHAYHQELSILCELLAAKEHLQNSKICIILSPSWFQDQAGTNTEAFIEFVRPNFLNKIANDSTIANKYRLHLGDYIHRNADKFSVLSPSMKILRDEFLENQGWAFESYISKKIMGDHKTFPTSYSVTVAEMSTPKTWKQDWEELSKDLQTSFMAGVSNNKMWVNNTYYSEHLFQSNGAVKHGNPDYVDINNCEEFNDFNLLVDFMKESHVNCSFVIQALNPHFYNDLDRYHDLLTAIKKNLDKNKIPYLDMFVTEKQDYSPGILKDVMHLGDYGWMKINRFLYTTYYE